MVANPNQRNGHDNPIQARSTQSPEDTFKLVAETRRQVSQVAESAREAIEAFYTEPHLLAEFIERHGTPVYALKCSIVANFILKTLGFEPGFILPDSSCRFNWLKRILTFYDQIFTQEKIITRDFKNGLFVIPCPLFTVGFLSHQLHHWLAFRSGMNGYCERARRLYKKFWTENRGQIGSEVYKMDVEDIIALKAAINRDLEALKFLKGIADEILIPARQARRISSGTASA